MTRFQILVVFLLLTTCTYAQNIGIGTPNPDYTLDINGTLGINDLIYHNDDDDTWLGFPANDSFEIVVGGKRMVLADGVNNRLTLNSDGLGTQFIILADGIEHLFHVNPSTKMIGIGMSNPSYLVDIDGDFRVIGDAIEHLFFIDSANDKIGVGTNTPSYLVDVGGDFRVIGDGIEHLFFVDASAGRVGVGTATPSYDLDVTGSMRIQGLTSNDVFIVDAANQRVGINTSTPLCAFDVVGEIAGDQLKLANNPLPFLETVQTGIVDSLYATSGNESDQIIVTFPTAFSGTPYVMGTLTNKTAVSENIYINSVRSVSNTQAIFNVAIYGTGNPIDTLRLTWMAWE